MDSSFSRAMEIDSDYEMEVDQEEEEEEEEENSSSSSSESFTTDNNDTTLQVLLACAQSETSTVSIPHGKRPKVYQLGLNIEVLDDQLADEWCSLTDWLRDVRADDRASTRKLESEMIKTPTLETVIPYQ
ncbi:hypothetical protein J6590_037077 [Homalodisca vitripennis]|nr:hypothetical protein J6590_037077 [Homalodisca vitripennis]